MTKILAIETSLGKCSVALHTGIEIDYVESPDHSNQSEQLFTYINSLLIKHNIDYKDLDIIACTVGPGSFTGLRIGIAAARGMKKALPHVMLVGVTTLQLMAFARGTPGKIVLNAYGKECYVQSFDDNFSPVDEIAVVQEDAPAPHAVNARTLIEFVLYLEKNNRLHEFKNVQPVYVKKPNITMPKALGG